MVMCNLNKDHTAFFLPCFVLGKSSYVSVFFLVKDEYNTKSSTLLLNQEESVSVFPHVEKSCYGLRITAMQNLNVPFSVLAK